MRIFQPKQAGEPGPAGEPGAAGAAGESGAAGTECRELIASAAGGDITAFEALYRTFAPRIFGLCLRLTGQREAAEDCTQESFMAAWRGLARFEGRSSFSTWLQRIAIHTALGRRRGLRVVREVAEPAAGLPDMPDPGSGPPAIDMERAIAALPDGARHVLVLVGIYGFSHAEAAAALGVSEGSSKTQLHRARGLLSSALGLEAT